MIRRSRLSVPLLVTPLLLLLSGCPSGLGIPGDPIDCFWEFSVSGDTEISGSSAAHTFAGDGAGPIGFFLSLFQPGNTGVSGQVESFPEPTGGQTGQFDVELAITSTADARSWTVGEDAEDTFATLTVARNTTTELQGTITGICATMIQGERVTRAFTLTFRSTHGIPGAPDCVGE